MTDEELLATIHLAMVPHVGPKTMSELLARFGTAQGVLAAPAARWRDVPNVGPKVCRELASDTWRKAAEDELAYCREQGITIIPRGTPQYPQRLREIDDPPTLLYLRGAFAPHDDLAVAIVGTRGATPYGRRIAEQFAAGLVQAGYTVVSGLAAGIDEHAHRGALIGKGRTIAVLGSGVDCVYPSQNIPLAHEIVSTGSGVVMSENSPRTPPSAGLFPRRNRIVTGLSLGTVVIEADKASGAMISARLAGEQGREVFAVPGPIDRHTSRGCHALLRDGAKLVECVDDILEELGPLATPAKTATGETVRHPAELQLNELETQVLQAISPEATLIDNVIATSGLPAHRVLSTLSVLEMRRLVRRVSGNQVARV
jgi:DNA processing protein